MSKLNQKGALHLFLVLFAAILIAFFVFSKNLTFDNFYTLFGQKANALGVTCQATDAASFKNCAAQVNSGTADNIEVLSQITCSGADACGVNISGVNNRPVSIYGRDGIGSGLKRVDTYNYDLIAVSNSSNVSIYNLLIDEDNSQPCTPVTDSPNCRNTIKISGSSNVLVDQVTILNSKNTAVSTFNSRQITITNSKFINSYLFAIIINGQGGVTDSGIRIENNLLKDTKSNGLVMYFVPSLASNPSIIKGNLLIHNHRENVYNLCGPSRTEPCSGGQVLVRASNNIKIEENIIKDGSSDQYPNTDKVTGGIEIDSYDISNLNIVNNDIHNNTMWGIYINPNPTNVSNVLIANNKLYSNGTNPLYGNLNIANFPPGSNIKTESGNCFSANCQTLLAGKIFGDPNPCRIDVEASASSCLSKINWSTNDASASTITTNGQTFASGESGIQDANGINGDGSWFELLDGTTLLDKIFVIGLPQTSTQSAVPAPPAALPVLPAVSLTLPTNGSTVSSIVNLEASVSDPVAKVDFFVDGVFLSSDTSSPFTGSWDTGSLPNNSFHTIFAKATSNDNKTSMSFLHGVTVVDATPPTVTITNPATGKTVNKNTTINIAATASDSSGISKVEFSVNGALKCTDTSSPYTCSYKVPNVRNATYTIQAKAFDTVGNTANSSVTVTSK